MKIFGAIFLILSVERIRGLQFSCSSEESLAPVTGDPQPIGSLPYNFYVLNSNGDVTRHFLDEIYTIVVNGSEKFKQFLIQARLAVKENFFADSSQRTGKFVEDETWRREGVRMMPCLSADTIVSRNSKNKQQIRVHWKPSVLDQNVQFLITIAKDNSTFWIRWAPKLGLLMPAEVQIQSGKTQSDDQQQSEGSLSPQVATSNGVTQTIDSKMTSYETEREGSSNVNFGLPVTTSRDLQESSTFSAQNIVTERHDQNSAEKDENLKNLPSVPFIDQEQSTVTIQQELLKISAENYLLSTKFPEGKGMLPMENFTVNFHPQPHVFETESKVPVPRTPPIVRISVTEKPAVDHCASNPCLNNATCNTLDFQETFECSCPKKFLGPTCEKPNPCFSNPCKNLGDCNLISDTTFECHCRPEWSGKLCDDSCPSYLCAAGGSCRFDDGQYLCKCRPGFGGSRCETEIDPCVPNPCENHGNCTRGNEGAFRCECQNGFMGRKCHRPCQDVYRSCDFWKEQDKCEDMRPSTRFFDINCAMSCDQCIYINATVRTIMPLPPILEPFEFLLGVWTTESSSIERFPTNFESATHGFKQSLSFLVANVTMFGTPLLNYSCDAVNVFDPSDIQRSVGFLTLKLDGPEQIKAWIWSTGNDGISIVEEGTLKPNLLTVNSTTLYSMPSVRSKLPKQLKRTFKLHNDYLEEKFDRTMENGEVQEYTRYYSKVSPYVTY